MNSDQRLGRARELVVQLEAGNQAEAEAIISDLANFRENELFLEVGRLTRELHEAINSFLLNAEISTLAHIDIPDVGQRLSYVITMTENSANASLSAVETGLPLADLLETRARFITRRLEKLNELGAASEEVEQFHNELKEFLHLVKGNSSELHKKLTEILIAQDFQDLTGQIIRQVITLVRNVEDKLVQLVRISGTKAPQREETKHDLDGPLVPGIDQGDVVENQDDVDDLLSSLGF
ncbi:MAG: protein phosphatase CheZ [Candidatus Sedimenticola sp. (ex Thyasira tokunagai)]